MKKIGVVGAGTMGRGIAQLAAQNGHETWLYDTHLGSLHNGYKSVLESWQKLEEKGKLSAEEHKMAKKNLRTAEGIDAFQYCDLVIEAIVENEEIKKDLFQALERICPEQCILASNTSSLSITSLAGHCKHPERVVGIHFFNPAPVMPLVEVIPALQTDEMVVYASRAIIDSWGKTTVLAKDTPGFIVNRVARPFYGEALRIYEEGIADFATIDLAMKEIGGFRMGPFELMDFIGNDVNYAVTESVFSAMYFDPRYKPSLTQKRHVEAGWLGRKSGRGYYDYSNGAPDMKSIASELRLREIFDRILAMLINEAADAIYWNIAHLPHVELAMTKGTNYPKGLLKWADEMGIQKVYDQLCALQEKYQEDRYRPSPLLKAMAESGESFYQE